MILSKKHNFIFIKTRKTAGSTLEKLVFPYLSDEDICTGSDRDGTPAKNLPKNMNGHVGWDQIHMNFSGDKWWDKIFKFTIERNPWDKVVSSYYWHQKIKPQQFASMDFETYVLTCTLLPYDYPLYANRGTLKVDKIYKYEEMWDMYLDINERFGFDIKEDQVYNTKLKGNIRQTADYHDMHTPKTIDFVAEKFKPVIEMMKYEY